MARKHSNDGVNPTDDGSHASPSVDESNRDEIAGALAKAVADSYVLYAKTLGVHWNV